MPTKDNFTDYDFMEFINYASFPPEDIEETIAQSEGNPDGPSWLGVYKLHDGRYGYVCAGCCYTGWDSQTSGYSEVSETLEFLVWFKIPQEERRRLDLTDTPRPTED